MKENNRFLNTILWFTEFPEDSASPAGSASQMIDAKVEYFVGCFCSNKSPEINSKVLFYILDLSHKKKFGDTFLDIMEAAATKDLEIGQQIRKATKAFSPLADTPKFTNACKINRDKPQNGAQ